MNYPYFCTINDTLGNILIIEPTPSPRVTITAELAPESSITVSVYASNQYTLVTPVMIVTVHLRHSASTTRLVRLAHRLP